MTSMNTSSSFSSVFTSGLNTISNTITTNSIYCNALIQQQQPHMRVWPHHTFIQNTAKRKLRRRGDAFTGPDTGGAISYDVHNYRRGLIELGLLGTDEIIGGRLSAATATERDYGTFTHHIGRGNFLLSRKSSKDKNNCLHHNRSYHNGGFFYYPSLRSMSSSSCILYATRQSTSESSSVKKRKNRKSQKKIKPQNQQSPSAKDGTTSTATTKKKQQRERNWTSSTTSITGKWKEFFMLLQTFKSQHGHTRVPYNYTPNPQLGRWVARQRMLYRNLKQQQEEEEQQQQTQSQSSLLRPATALTPERIEALQSIDFSFESPRTHTWTKRYDELCIYKSIHGDCLVPIKYDPFPGLGVWVRNQRTLYRNLQQAKANAKGKAASSYLSKEKISALQSIGFVWDTQRNDLWKKRFDELMDFRAVYGHCLVPEHYHENPQLGIWVVNQRTSYKNFLTGVAGGNGNERKINTNANDSSKNESDTPSDSKILWKRNGGKSLTREKIIALESIGFCWAQTTYNWYSMYARLKQYKEEKKERYIMELQEQQEKQGQKADKDNTNIDDEDINLPEFFQVPPEDVANRDLRLWIAVQRKEYSNYLRGRTSTTNIDHNDNGNNNNNTSYHNTTIKSAMTPRRIKALESIGFPWNISKNFRSSKNTSDNDSGPSVDDWTKLFEQMREKGIDSNMRPKEHWFEGQSLLNDDNAVDNDFVKKDLNKEWTDEDLLALWNMEGDDDF